MAKDNYRFIKLTVAGTALDFHKIPFSFVFTQNQNLSKDTI
jgi:hypothetical protein